MMKSTVDSRSKGEAEISEVMDVEEALERLGNDEDLFRDIVQNYLEDAPGILSKIHAAADGSDSQTLQRAAHSLKGLASTLSAHEVVGASSKLEYMGASHNLAETAKALEDLDRRVEELNRTIEQLLRRT
jgi:two-component system sensor histidine kinase/response regulator